MEPGGQACLRMLRGICCAAAYQLHTGDRVNRSNSVISRIPCHVSLCHDGRHITVSKSRSIHVNREKNVFVVIASARWSWNETKRSLRTVCCCTESIHKRRPLRRGVRVDNKMNHIVAISPRTGDAKTFLFVAKLQELHCTRVGAHNFGSKEFVASRQQVAMFLSTRQWLYAMESADIFRNLFYCNCQKCLVPNNTAVVHSNHNAQLTKSNYWSIRTETKSESLKMAYSCRAYANAIRASARHFRASALRLKKTEHRSPNRQPMLINNFSRRCNASWRYGFP